MKKLLSTLAIFMFCVTYAVSVSADTTTYNLDDIGLTVEIPSEYSVFTREIDDNDTNLKKHGLTKDTMLTFLESSNIYLLALPDNEKHVIYISADTLNTEIKSLKSLSEENLNDLIETMKDTLTNTDLSMSEHSFYMHKDKLFIKYIVQKSGNDYRINHCTIHNYQGFNVVLDTFTGKFTDSEKNTIDTIAKSIITHDPPVPTNSFADDVYEPLTAINYIIQLLPIIIIILIVTAIVVYKSKKRKQKD